MSDDILAAHLTHQQALVVDGHSDIPMDVVNRRRRGESHVLGRLHLPAWREGGVNAAVLTVGGDQSLEASPSRYAMEAIDHLRNDVADQLQDLTIVTTAADLSREVENGRFAILMNMEGGMPLEGSLENLGRFHELGVRFMTLTWNVRNELGTGASHRDSDGGLTEFGTRVVKSMADMGMVADLSHASTDTFWDAVGLEQGNLVASHSNVAGLCPHTRNLTDEQIRALADQDGFVGITFFPEFLHGDRPGAREVVDHIAYIGELVGIEHVVLGTDYIDFAKEEIEARLRQSGAYDASEFEYPRGLKTIRSLPNLTCEMTKRGFSDGDISAVLGGNFLRVCHRILDERQTG